MGAEGFAATIATRQGPFTVVVDDEAVLASGWTDDLARLIGLIHPSLRPDVVSLADPDVWGLAEAGNEVLMRAIVAVRAYDDGNTRLVAQMPVKAKGGPFRQAVWRTLRDISPGQHLSYAELAARSGRPSAVRAAGGACGANPAALFVPCHRVVRSDGSLGGFAYGLACKQALLDAEATS